MALSFLQSCVRHSWPGCRARLYNAAGPSTFHTPEALLATASPLHYSYKIPPHASFDPFIQNTALYQQPALKCSQIHTETRFCLCALRPTVHKALLLTPLSRSSVKAWFKAKITVTGADRYLSRPSAEPAMKIKARCSSLF